MSDPDSFQVAASRAYSAHGDEAWNRLNHRERSFAIAKSCGASMRNRSPLGWNRLQPAVRPAPGNLNGTESRSRAACLLSGRGRSSVAPAQRTPTKSGRPGVASRQPPKVGGKRRATRSAAALSYCWKLIFRNNLRPLPFASLTAARVNGH
jgi:hypothetical protein